MLTGTVVCAQHWCGSACLSNLSVFFCSSCVFGRVHAASTRACGLQAVAPRARDQAHRPRATCSGLAFLLATNVPVSSCTVPRRHGRMTHQPGSLYVLPASTSSSDTAHQLRYGQCVKACLAMSPSVLRGPSLAWLL